MPSQRTVARLAGVLHYDYREDSGAVWLCYSESKVYRNSY